MRQIYMTAFLLLILTAVASAAAAKNPIYLTAKVGNTSFDSDDDPGDPVNHLVDGDDGSWGLGVGVRLGKHLAFQAEVQDLGNAPGIGNPCPDDFICLIPEVPVEADSTAISVSVLPQLELSERFSIYGKLGLAFWESDVSEIEVTALRFRESLDSEDLLYGAGLRFLLPGRFGVLVEHERIADLFATTSVGVTYDF